MIIENGYNKIAEEYYSNRHITSQNFDLSQFDFFKENAEIINKYLPSPLSLALDLGCGSGRLNKFLNIHLNRIVQLDKSDKMLSLENRENVLLQIIGNAKETPFSNNSFNLVGAFLFDPFNEQSFYKELNRILKPNGIFIGTLPHISWGKTLRNHLGISIEKTRFLLKSGDILETPSYLSTNEEIEKYFNDNSFDIKELIDIKLSKNISNISDQILIPAKLLNVSPYELNIVKLIIVQKS